LPQLALQVVGGLTPAAGFENPARDFTYGWLKLKGAQTFSIEGHGIH